MADDRLVVFDCETSGLDPRRHAIIQLAAVAVDRQWQEVEAFERKLLFPEWEADPEALGLNSYDPEVWERDGVPPPEAQVAFSAFLRRHATVNMVSRAGKPYQVARLVGHNAASFDGEFVRAWYRANDAFLPASYQVYDTLQLALWAFDQRADKPTRLALSPGVR